MVCQNDQADSDHHNDRNDRPRYSDRVIKQPVQTAADHAAAPFHIPAEFEDLLRGIVFGCIQVLLQQAADHGNSQHNAAEGQHFRSAEAILPPDHRSRCREEHEQGQNIGSQAEKPEHDLGKNIAGRSCHPEHGQHQEDRGTEKNDQTDVPDSLLPPHFLFQFHALRRCSGSSPASRCGRAGALLPACGRSGLITGFAASTAAGLFPAGGPGLFLSTGSLDGGLCCFTRHIEKSLSGAGRQLPAGAPS